MRYKLINSPPKPQNTHPVIISFLQESPWFVAENDVNNIDELNLQAYVMPKGLASGNYDLIYHLTNEYGLTAKDISGFVSQVSNNFEIFKKLDSQMDLVSLYPNLFEKAIKEKFTSAIDFFIDKKVFTKYVKGLFHGLDVDNNYSNLQTRKLLAIKTLEDLEIVISHDNLLNYVVKEIKFNAKTLDNIQEVMPYEMFQKLIHKIKRQDLLNSLETNLEIKPSKSKIKI